MHGVVGSGEGKDERRTTWLSARQASVGLEDEEAQRRGGGRGGLRT